MGLFRCTARKKGHSGHKWTYWKHNGSGLAAIASRSCNCGAIQRYNPSTGEVTIWTPDGLTSRLLDKGITRQIYEDL